MEEKGRGGEAGRKVRGMGDGQSSHNSKTSSINGSWQLLRHFSSSSEGAGRRRGQPLSNVDPEKEREGNDTER